MCCFGRILNRKTPENLISEIVYYTLYLILRNELGFRPPSNAFDVYEFAENVLLEGWSDI